MFQCCKWPNMKTQSRYQDTLFASPNGQKAGSFLQKTVLLDSVYCLLFGGNIRVVFSNEIYQSKSSKAPDIKSYVAPIVRIFEMP